MYTSILFLGLLNLASASTTQTTVLSTPITSLPGSFSASASPTCVTGNPVDVGNGFTVTSFTTLPHPPPTISVNFAPEATFASQFQIGTTDLFVSKSMQSYAEFKCQFQCDPGQGCLSWFIGWDFAGSFWRCIRFSSLLQSFDIVPDPLNRYYGAVGFDALCPAPTTPPKTCTNGQPVTLGPGSTVSYALVTPTTPLPPTGTGLGYMLPTAWSDANYISEADIVLPDTAKDAAEYQCQFNCTSKPTCESWFVGFLIKGAAGYYWRCTQYSALITPDLLVPTNQALLRNGTGWDKICNSTGGG